MKEAKEAVRRYLESLKGDTTWYELAAAKAKRPDEFGDVVVSAEVNICHRFSKSAYVHKQKTNWVFIYGTSDKVLMDESWEVLA